MNIYLSRHGNTFAPGDKVVWTGGNLDLPLVDKGREQAKEFASALALKGIVPNSIYCGPLKRTREYSKILISNLKLTIDPIIDTRLDELDYGEWSGLTNEEVELQYGIVDQANWNSESIWPRNAGWGSSERQVTSEVEEFAAELVGQHSPDDSIIIVSSNGRLRYFLKLIEGEFEKRISNQTFKVKTGNICKLNYDDYLYRVEFWDQLPKRL